MRNLPWLAIAFFFFITGCTKIESTTIGSGLIPPIDGVTTLDTTLDVFTNNYFNNTDSLLVYKSDDHVIGIINNDPIFGKTSATTYFELKPTQYKNYFPGGSSLIADSAVLILSYKGFYGDSTIPQTWEVREVTSEIKNDSLYPVATQFPVAGSVLGSKTINIPSLRDLINDVYENASNQIRIKLSSSFASRLMKQYDLLPNHPYESDSLFRLSFKGFAVMPASGSAGNALIKINLLDSNTKLALFYKYKSSETATTYDTTVSYFRYSTGGSVIPVSGSANHIKRDYNGSEVKKFVENASENDSLVYIQTSPGTFATLKIPGLRNLPNSIIHLAELFTYQVPEASGLEKVLTPPRYLLLSAYDSVNKVKTNIPNDYIVGTSGNNIQTFGGYLLDQSVGNLVVKAYRFDVSRYVQGIVTRKDSSFTLRLSAPTNDSLVYTPPYPSNTITSKYYINTSNANNTVDGRIRLGGGGMFTGNPFRMRLRIIYSKI